MATIAQDVSAPRVVPGMTVAQARRALAETLRHAGIESPELDARLLTGHAVGLDHTGLTVQSARKLNEREARGLAALARERLMRKPVARIIGAKEFWGLTLRVGEATLVPRPETETVVEAALAAIDRGGPRTRPLRIADLGTGSGALLLALLSELTNATGIGTDFNLGALALARDNARRLNLRSRALFAACDFGAALRRGFDLVVSNPPYVATPDIAALAPEVRHDPLSALDGGADGLACYRVIAAQAPNLLAPGGDLVVELGAGQEPAVAALFAAAGLCASPACVDLADIPRALRASMRP